MDQNHIFSNAHLNDENPKNLQSHQQNNPGSAVSSTLGLKKFGSTPTLQNYGLSSTLSASTLQHSNLVWGFSKAERFPTLKPKYEGQNYIELPSTLNKGTTTFGFGNKINMAEIYSKQARNLPAPNHYHLKSTITTEHTKGKSFGLPYNAYSHTYQPNLTMQTPEVAHLLPGPGQYKIDEDIGTKKKKTTLKSRVKWFFEELKPQAPPANYYTPNRELVESARFKNITQGIGDRLNFTGSGSLAPGPGTYRLPSVFDKFDKTRNNKKGGKHSRARTQERGIKNSTNFDDDDQLNNNIHYKAKLNEASEGSDIEESNNGIGSENKNYKNETNDNNND